MTEELPPEGQADATPAGDNATAVEPQPNADEAKKLRQDVEIKDVGPCKKHIKVSVNREDIDARFAEHFGKLVKDSQVPGFRPGKAPRRLVEMQFKKDVGAQVKNEV